eukprot:3816066-Pyramimonas_sp.AAC.2
MDFLEGAVDLPNNKLRPGTLQAAIDMTRLGNGHRVVEVVRALDQPAKVLAAAPGRCHFHGEVIHAW